MPSGQISARKLYRHLIEVLKKNYIEHPDLEARIILDHALGYDARVDIMVDRVWISPDIAHRIETMLQRRCSGEPMAYITGCKEFWGLNFMVTPATLIPRPDSEVLIETTLQEFPDPERNIHILDLGTGTGCLLISLLHEYRYATGVGVDQSVTACHVALENAKYHRVHDRCQFKTGHWLDALGLDAMDLDAMDLDDLGDLDGLDKPFDLIISNPPYIPAADIPTLPMDIRDFEPHTALDGGTDGCDPYRIFAQCLAKILVPNGKLVLEIGYNQAQSVIAIFKNMGWNDHRLVKDLSNHDRCLVFSYPNTNVPGLIATT